MDGRDPQRAPMPWRPPDAAPDVLAWERRHDGERLLAAVNLAAVPMPLGLHDPPAGRTALLLSTDPERGDKDVHAAELTLARGEAVLLRPAG